jgi:hypothetical protein
VENNKDGENDEGGPEYEKKNIWTGCIFKDKRQSLFICRHTITITIFFDRIFSLCFFAFTNVVLKKRVDTASTALVVFHMAHIFHSHVLID